MVIVKKYRRFRSEDSVRAFMRRRECRKYTFSTFNSKKISAKIQAGRKYKLNDALVYADLKFRCSRGGDHIERIKGDKRQRQRTSTKNGCPAIFKFLPSKNGQALELREYNLVHTCDKQKEQELQMTVSGLWSSIEDTVNMQLMESVLNDSVGDDISAERQEPARAIDDNSSSSSRLNVDITEIPDKFEDFIADKNLFNSTINEQNEGENMVHSEDSSEQSSETGNTDVADLSSHLAQCQLEKPPVVKKNKKSPAFNTSFKLDMSQERKREKKLTIIQDKKKETNKKVKIYSVDVNSKTIKLDNRTDATAIKMPTIKKCRGRPKGQKTKRKITKTLKFVNKTKEQKIQQILLYLFGEKTATKVIKNKSRLLSTDLPDKSELLPDFFHDEDVKATDVRKYFDSIAFNKLLKLIEEKRGNGVYTCPECDENAKENQDLIGCDSCLSWFHMSCVPEGAGNEETWFCNSCDE